MCTCETIVGYHVRPRQPGPPGVSGSVWTGSHSFTVAAPSSEAGEPPDPGPDVYSSSRARTPTGAEKEVEHVSLARVLGFTGADGGPPLQAGELPRGPEQAFTAGRGDDQR